MCVSWLRVLVLALFSLTLSVAGCSSHEDSPASPAPAPVSDDTTANTTNDACESASFPSGRTLQYCIKRSTASAHPTNVVYFFHGLGGSASDIFKEPFATALRLALDELGPQMPHVVSVSFGSSAAIPIDTDGLANSMASELTNLGFPAIEQELGYGSTTPQSTPPRRQLMGVSMGGFNVLSLSASQPGKFKTVISLCPALIDFDPFNPSEVEAYIKRHAPYVKRAKVKTAIDLLKTNFPTLESWRKSDPIRRIVEGRYASLPLFVSIGRQDEYGFIEGTQAFVAAAQTRRLSIVWKPVNGPHCYFDLAALTDFLKANL